MPKAKLKARKQVAALPVIYDEVGTLRVLLITSRETKRLIIPKGWPIKSFKDHRAAAIEARQEIGLIGRVHKRPVGSYTYWKRLADHFLYCRVRVFILEVTSQLTDWREKGQRRGVWLLVDDAAELVDDPGLVTIIRDLPATLPRTRRRGPAGRKPEKRLEVGNSADDQVRQVVISREWRRPELVGRLLSVQV